jgi:hypothetical protein
MTDHTTEKDQKPNRCRYSPRGRHWWAIYDDHCICLNCGLEGEQPK